MENQENGPENICQICSAKAPGSVKFYHHYGAICCYSCKGFFRRYTRGETPAYNCKENGHCELNKGRKTCKSCRYQRCLQVGMAPENLLNEEDRKKYTHPKKRKKSPNVEEQSTKHKSVDNATLIEIIQKSFGESIIEMNFDIEEIKTLILT